MPYRYGPLGVHQLHVPVPVLSRRTVSICRQGCHAERMGELREPVPDDVEELRTLWERQHPRVFRGEDEVFDAEAFRSELVATAAEQEQTYLPWADRLAAVRSAGISESVSGKSRFTNLGPVRSYIQADDLFEGLGWFSLFEASANALAELEELVFNPAPSVPDHWQVADLVHDPDDVDEIWGSVSDRAQLTRLSVAALRPASRIGLLRLVGESPQGSNAFSYGALATVREWFEITPLPQNIAGLVAVCGVACGQIDRIDDPLARRIAQLHHAIESADRTGDALEARALREEVLQIGRDSPGALAAGAEWFLALRSEAHDSALAAFALESPALLEAVAGIAGSAGPVRRRAEGFILSVEQGDMGSLTSTIVWWTDTRRYRAPAPVSAPTSMWLNDAVLETEIRSRLDGAVARLVETGISEETEVTGALIQQLASVFDVTEVPPQSLVSPPFTLEITSTNATKHEPTSGADLGIVVDVAAEGIELVIGHLVQVKQASNREDQTAPPGWLIGFEQLRILLAQDPTATYWLIQQHHSPKVIAVPAKLLLGIFHARKATTAITVTWADVRSAAASLGQMLLDLLVGLWIGSTNAALVEMAQGRDSRHSPASVLHVRIRADG